MSKIKIFATTDIHASVRQNSNHTIFPTQLTKRNLDTTILIDNGDTFIGSTHGTFFNHTMEISPIVNMINDANYDVVVVGNHDLDLGIDFLRNQIKYLNAKYVCCNLFDNNDNLIFEPYAIIEKSNMKIAVIGAVTSALSQVCNPLELNDYKFSDATQSIKKYVDSLRDSVDIVVVSYHGGAEKNMIDGSDATYSTGEDEAYKISRFVKGIDVLIYGHQHFLNHGILNNFAYMQPASHMKCIGVIDIDKSENYIKFNTYVIESKNYIFEHTSKSYFNQDDFKNYMNSKLNPALIEQFVNTYYNSPNFILKLKGETLQDFYDSFSIPYGMSSYLLSYDEFAEYMDNMNFENYTYIKDRLIERYIEKNIKLERYSDLKFIEIISNDKSLPKYRLIKNNVLNNFELYIYYLNKIIK